MKFLDRERTKLRVSRITIYIGAFYLKDEFRGKQGWGRSILLLRRIDRIKMAIILPIILQIILLKTKRKRNRRRREVSPENILIGLLTQLL